MIQNIKTFLKKYKPTHTFHPNYDDEFYINQVIGIEEITYEDWISE
jgi:hypothetical protein